MASESNVLIPGNEYRDYSEANQIHYLISAMINNTVNVAIPVRVDSVEIGANGVAGWVSATPLVTDRDLHGNMIKPVSIPRLPFFRYRCGTAAVIVNPRVGDVGVAVFAHKDISQVKPNVKEPRNAGSFRKFDYSDGIYFGGLFGDAKPTTTIELDPDKGLIQVDCQKMVVNAPSIVLNGEVQTTKSVQVANNVVAGGEVTGKGIQLSTHTHPCGDHSTGTPQ